MEDAKFFINDGYPKDFSISRQDSILSIVTLDDKLKIANL